MRMDFKTHIQMWRMKLCIDTCSKIIPEFRKAEGSSTRGVVEGEDELTSELGTQPSVRSTRV